ncbi:MAG: ribosome silencing factor [Clostridiaceae bacterium]|nr:ribosome silencing factor [Clostridiaceae bacterium]
MDIEKLKDEIVDILDNKKAIDIEVLPVKDKTILADYFIIASGSSNTQVRALTDEVIYEIEKRLHITPKRKEGDSKNRWNLLDYQDVIVHIFHQEEREFYQIEKLWHGPIIKDIVDN